MTGDDTPAPTAGEWSVDGNTVIGQADEIIECYVDQYPDTIAAPDLARRVADLLNRAGAAHDLTALASVEQVRALADRIRSEADQAARAGQCDRLHAIADEVAAFVREDGDR
jgi:hypothetical protein